MKMTLEQEVEELEKIIRQMAMASSHVCSMMVSAEVLKSIPDHEQAKDLMTAISKLHELCTHPIVEGIFSKIHEGNGRD